MKLTENQVQYLKVLWSKRDSAMKNARPLKYIGIYDLCVLISSVILASGKYFPAMADAAKFAFEMQVLLTLIMYIWMIFAFVLITDAEVGKMEKVKIESTYLSPAFIDSMRHSWFSKCITHIPVMAFFLYTNLSGYVVFLGVHAVLSMFYISRGQKLVMRLLEKHA